MTEKDGRQAHHAEKAPAGAVDPTDTAPNAEENRVPVTAGARGRIVRASPPAPVPEKRPTPSVQNTTVPPEEDKSALTGRNAEIEASNQDVIRATGTMAIATLLSRITGFLRQMLIGATLGATVGTAFSSANQIPNLVTEIVLGAVLTSLVVPVLVRAEKEDSDRGETFVRRLFTLAFSILGIVTILSVIFAPFLTRMMLPEDSKANAVQATSLAFLLLPQILFYGLFALFQAVLNTKNIFGPGAWAPVVHNISSISVLLAYRFLPGRLDPHEPTPVADPHIMLLGLGTTTAVIVQCFILVPYLKKAGINLRPKWGLDARIKQFGGMALALITYVAISQLGYVITSRVAAYADAGAPLVYQNAWLMLQVPYGVIGVTLLTAIMPRLSRNAADGDVDAVVRDLTLGTKLTFIALIPIVIFMTGFGVPIARALFQYGAYGADSAEQLGLTISFSAFTLIPYALVLLHLRVFYAREEAWTPTFIIAGITLTKIVLTLLAPLMTSNPDRVVILLGTANGFGFVSGAVIGGFLLKRKLGSLGGKAVTQTVLWSSGAGAVGLVVSWALYWLVQLFLPEQLPSIVSLVNVVVLGIVFVIITGLVLSKSSLPEVQNLARALQRIPGMSRFITVDNSKAIEVEEPDLQEIQPVYTQDSFNATLVPPPMSAGIVRGPRLVPGAPVSDGRFRLLQDHGAVSGARFWQAREQATGRLVALTFVDTNTQAPIAPSTPTVSARRSAEISRNTRRLAELNLETMADNIEILSYRTGCLVVADWFEGTSLKQVAEADNLDPNSVARATAPLFADAATAHDAGLILGVEHRDRFRVSTSGIVKVAFPAVLDGTSAESDREALSSALSMLVESTEPSPKKLRDISDDANLTADEAAERLEEARLAFDAADAETREEKLEELQEAEGLTSAGIAKRLREFAPEEQEEKTEALPVVVEDEPTQEEDPKQEPGFGGRGYSGSGVVVIGIFATIFVVGMAALTTWVMSLLSDVEKTSSVTETVQGSTMIPDTPPVHLKESSAITVPDGEDNEQLIDGKTITTWSTKESGSGALVTLDNPAHLSVMTVTHTRSNGAHYEIYGVNKDDFDPKHPQLSSLPKLAEGKFKHLNEELELKEAPQQFDAALIVITELPKAKEVTLGEVQLVGHP